MSKREWKSGPQNKAFLKDCARASRRASQRAANLHHQAAINKNHGGAEKIVAVSPVKAADRPR